MEVSTFLESFKPTRRSSPLAHNSRKNPGGSRAYQSNAHRNCRAEAISTAAYLRNRSPTRAVAGMIPNEAWTGQKPQVDGLQVFGCQAFVHIPKEERKKLDSKSKGCIYLGYGATTKGYHLYDPLKKRVCLSRDVIFNKNKCGQLESEEGAEGHMYLEYSDESEKQLTTQNLLHVDLHESEDHLMTTVISVICLPLKSQSVLRML